MAAGTLVAMVLHAIMPEDAPMIDGSSDEAEEEEEEEGSQSKSRRRRKTSAYDTASTPMDFSMPAVKRTSSAARSRAEAEVA
eukprot:3635863-Rhodomonas_salina.1